MQVAFCPASMVQPPATVAMHLPVMWREVRALLSPVLGPGRWALDCTFGRGGHTRALLETGASVLALDQDEEAFRSQASREDGLLEHPRLHLRHANFREAPRLLRELGLNGVDALLADLGVSSPQLDTPERGFSFRTAGPLDMRMDPSRGEPLSALLQTVDRVTLADVLWRYGEERRSRAIAAAILQARDQGQLNTTLELAELIRSQLRPQWGGAHPATRSFQALRIWVNDELGALEALLEALPSLLLNGGRGLFLAFHSLEDRPIKQRLRALSTGCRCPPEFPVCVCGEQAWGTLIGRSHKKASAEEVRENPRSRSVRLRGIERAGTRDEAVGPDDPLRETVGDRSEGLKPEGVQ